MSASPAACRRPETLPGGPDHLGSSVRPTGGEPRCVRVEPIQRIGDRDYKRGCAFNHPATFRLIAVSNPAWPSRSRRLRTRVDTCPSDSPSIVFC